MKKAVVLLLMVSVLLAACTAGTEQIQNEPLPDEIPWEQAVSLLQTGQVEQVIQAHSMKVTLYLKDGQQVDTVEPVIDAVFDEIQKCGAPCSNIVLAME